MRRCFTTAFFQICFVTVSLVALSACAGTGERRLAQKVPTKSFKTESAVLASKNLPSVVDYGASAGFGSLGVHSVLAGDTLESIGWQYKLNPDDISRLNGLSGSALLKAGTRIKLPPPEIYRVRQGDTVTFIARLFNVPASDLLVLNRLDISKTLMTGQNLRLPRPSFRMQSASKIDGANSVDVTQRGKVEVNTVVFAEPLPPVIAPPVQVAGGGMMTIPLRKPDIHTVSLPSPSSRTERTSAQDVLPPTSGRFLKPVSGAILSRFGPKPGGLYNEGINIAATRGTPVRAAEGGRVVYVGNAVEGYGNLVLVKHAGGYITAYAHMDKTFAKEGQILKRGHTIGTVGATGNVDRAQLHFEIRKGRESVDPATMI